MKIFPHALMLSMLMSGFVFAQTAAKPDEKFSLKVPTVLTQCESLSGEENSAIAKLIKDLTPQPAEAGKESVKIPSEVKIKAAETFGNSCSAKAIEPLVSLLADTEPLVRVAAVEALGKLGERESAKNLEDLYGDPDWRVRYALGAALFAYPVFVVRAAANNSIGGGSPVDVTTDGDMIARCNAILQAQQVNDPSFSRKTINFLFGYLDSDNPIVKKYAQETMKLLPSTRNGQFELIGCLKSHANPNWRKKAAYWIGELKMERGRAAVENAIANDVDATVKQWAKEALAKFPKQE
jgi:HEAT repeats